MSSESKRRRLRNLFKLNPRCFWCNCLTTLENRNTKYVKLPLNSATLDHLISRNDKKWRKGMKNRLVLCCSECNNGRQAEETRGFPIEELWRRSGRYPTKEKIRNE